MISLMFYPLQCKCVDSNQVKKIVKMGCKNGGFPSCPRHNNLVCKDGTVLDWTTFFNYKLEGHKGCLCGDGIMPRCKDTDDVIKCPDGSYIDWNIGGPEDYADCEVEDFHVSDVI